MSGPVCVEFFHEILNQASIRNTVIYGSMDHSARNINLAKFRNGSINVLLVTDVAARGIGNILLLCFVNNNNNNDDDHCTCIIY